MPELETLLLFSIAAFALTITPGPDMLLIASRTVAQGRRAGFATWSGIAVGTYIHAMAAALGLSQLFQLVPIAFDVVRYIGAAYLAYLAWTTFMAREDAKSEKKNSKQVHSSRTMFMQGLLTNVLNPKVALFVLALFPQFIVLGSGPVVGQIMIFATIINGIGFFVNGVVILMADKASTSLAQNTGMKTAFRYCLASVFAGLALRLVLTDRSV